MNSASRDPATHVDPPVDAVEARAHVNSVVARSGTSFLWGLRVLPSERRRAMHAIYAFCREVDDIADEPGEIADKARALAAWRHEIARLYAGHPTWPTTKALLRPVKRFGLPEREFLAVIDGMEIDAAPAVPDAKPGGSPELLSKGCGLRGHAVDSCLRRASATGAR